MTEANNASLEVPLPPSDNDSPNGEDHPSVLMMNSLAHGQQTNHGSDLDVEAAIQQHQHNTNKQNNNNGKTASNKDDTTKQSSSFPKNNNSSNTTSMDASWRSNQDDDDASNHSKKKLTMSQRLRRQISNPSSDNKSPNTSHPAIRIPPATKAPKETLKAVYAAGKYKAGLRWNVLAIQSFMAGVYIAAAGHLYLVVGGGLLGATVFPFGLIAVILTSAELFTGDALIFVASVLGKQVPLRSLIRNWTESWICNFLGCVAWAYFLGYLSDAIEDSHATETAIAIAEKKALNTYGSIFLKAIGANFLVCVAVWQGTCAEEVAGKVLALWFPTMAFVAMGFDHVVANMFLIPMGMMMGAKVSVGRFFAAIAVATCGNAVGGGIFVGAVYWYVFDSLASFGSLTNRIRQGINKGIAAAPHNSNNNNNSRSNSFLGGNISQGRTGLFGHRHHHNHPTPPVTQNSIAQPPAPLSKEEQLEAGEYKHA